MVRPASQGRIPCRHIQARSRLHVMVAVLGVHGIKQQQAGRNVLLDTWRPALRDGIELAVGRARRKELKPKLDLAYYGDLFLAAGHQRREKGREKKGVGELTVSEDEEQYFEEIEAELGDVLGDAPSVRTKGLKELPPAVGRLFSWLDRSFGAGAAVLFVGELRQVRRYQLDDEFAARVRDRVVELLDGVDVVVAHSLGSVVALETLVLNDGVQRLVTLGSPLALASVQRRLRVDREGSPAAEWTNVYDRSDAVACAGGLSGWWSGVTDVLVDNGSDPHSVVAYLCKRATGESVTGAVSEG